MKSPVNHHTATTGAIEEVHRAFYQAWEDGDVDAALACWSRVDDISVTFPGGRPTCGHDGVRRHLVEGIELTAGIQFFFEDLRIAVRGSIARLTCIENVTMPGHFNPAEFHDLLPSRLAVSSVYVHDGEGWRIWAHMSAPILNGIEAE